MANSSKTVYFLGAGFSADAGGPIQNQIIETLTFNEFKDCYPEDKDYLESFKEFLSKELHIDESQYSRVALEDVFTPIDRCLSDGKSLGHYSHEKLMNLRDKLHYLMAKSVKYGVDHPKHGTGSGYISDFAEFINGMAMDRLTSPSSDSVAVITTNWDILLDNKLNKILIEKTDNICKGDIKTGKIAVLDYCCYISSMDKDDDYIKPGLLALGRKGYNVKYLKLHGSMNWLHCPLCQRLYVGFDEKSIFNVGYCRHCKQNFGLNDDEESIKLKGNLLLPTFLKDLSNIQIQLIWQNAGIELSEATKVVFIGYSLPAADFEIRQLLSRFIRKDAKIEVVIYPDSKEKEDEQNRYKVFFGKRNVEFIEKKVPDYVADLKSEKGKPKR